MEARNRSLADWFTRIRTRQVVLPRFQRYEAWTYRHVEGLLDTVLRGLPAGALLVLEIGDTEPFVSRPVVGAPETGDRIAEHLLDGQQRLTALWRSLNDDYPERTYLLDLNSSDDEEREGDAPRTVSFARWERQGRRYPLWIDDPRQVRQRKLLPVRLLRPGPDVEEEYKEWAKAASGGSTDELIELVQLISSLRTRVANFNLPFLSLPVSTPAETALDVFVKMNTSAQPLSTFDIVVAQVEAATTESLHDLIEQLRRDAPGLERFADPSDVVLAAAAYLQDKPARRGIMLGEGFSRYLITHWDRLVSGARRASSFLEEEGVFDAARLPTDPVIPMFVALWCDVPDGLDAEGNARVVLRRFLWRSFLTDRYERSSNTRALADFKALCGLVQGEDGPVPGVFDEDAHQVPSPEELLSAGWPKKKDRLARAIMLVSLRSGGLDLADGRSATHEALGLREYHHIFPVAYLKERGHADHEIFRALNCALISWRTNRTISAKSPETYIKERAGASNLGEAEIRRRLASHLIDLDWLARGDYAAFLRDRAALIAEHARGLCA